MALTLSMYEDGIVYIGDDIKIQLHDLKKGYASMSVKAPKNLRISRMDGKLKLIRDEKYDDVPKSKR